MYLGRNHIELSEGTAGGEAYYKRTSSQSIPAASPTVLNADNLQKDTLTKGSVTTGATWRYTAIKPVKLAIHVRADSDSASWLGPASHGGIYLSARKNGLSHSSIGLEMVQSATYQARPFGTTFVDLVIGDYIDITIYSPITIGFSPFVYLTELA